MNFLTPINNYSEVILPKYAVVTEAKNEVKSTMTVRVKTQIEELSSVMAEFRKNLDLFKQTRQQVQRQHPNLYGPSISTNP